MDRCVSCQGTDKKCYGKLKGWARRCQNVLPEAGKRKGYHQRGYPDSQKKFLSKRSGGI